MKRNYLLIMLAAICLAACAETATKTEIKVTGELNDPKPLFLNHCLTGRDVIAEGQEAEGVITFNVEMEAPAIAMIGSSADGRTPLCAVILDGKPIEVNIEGEKVEIVKGSEQNMAFNEAKNRINTVSSQRDNLMKEYRELYKKHEGNIPADVMEGLEKRYDTITEGINATIKQVIQENANNLVPIYYLCMNGNDLGLDFAETFLSTYQHKDSEMLSSTYKMIKGDKNKQPGAMVADFAGKDLNGKECHLTDYVGKGQYVLVDFWASWCGPCRAEMPNVKANYEKYHGKGFEVVGISFDSDKEAWEKCVKDLGITWTQISDLKGWACAASDTFNIKAIPATILYGPDGKVIKANLRGEELGKTLAEYLDK